MFGSTEICAKYKIPLRHLQWLHDRGYVVPRVRGGRRSYTDEQVRLLLLIRKLREKKIPLQRIVPLLPNFRALLESMPNQRRFLFCGRYAKKLFLPKDSAELLRLASQYGGCVFLVEIF